MPPGAVELAPSSFISLVREFGSADRIEEVEWLAEMAREVGLVPLITMVAQHDN